jgi:predicted esterase
MVPRGDWLLVSVQAMHRFYRARSQDVVASWMTRQDRELAIADNVAYVGEVVEAVAREWPVAPTLVFSGFSQGVAMALRAAASSRRPVSGAIISGGDVPPEIDDTALSRLRRVLISRGDAAKLRSAGVEVVTHDFEGTHEWAQALIGAAAEFLGSLP